jgi:pilus assembly protein CpaF
MSIPSDEPAFEFGDLPLFDTSSKPVPPGPADHLAAAIRGRGATTPSSPRTSLPISADPASIPMIPFSPDAPATSLGQVSSGGLDRALVNGFRAEVSNRLSSRFAADESLDGEARLEVGRSQIVQVLRSHVDSLVREGLEPWDETFFNRMQKAIYDSLFRLGRLQELVDDPEVENVMIWGHDKVCLEYAGGVEKWMPPIADSDQQLIEDIQFIAGREGERGRPWSSSDFELSFSLPEGQRLQAIHPPILPVPTIVIRCHPPINWMLRDLVARGTLSEVAAAFLEAAVKARKSILVSGQQGTGKTTFTRALCHVMPPTEHIVTIESERELFLHKSPLHPKVTPFEARPGQGEPNRDGSRPGEVSVGRLLPSSLRHNTQRIIVGEVRGDEMIPMMQAMQAGAGSISTIHSNNAAGAVERMAVLLSSRGAPSEFGYKLIGQHIDFVVQLSNHLQGDRTAKRFLTEISELIPGEQTRPAINQIFAAPRGSDQAEPFQLPQPQMLEDLEAVGFDSDKWLRPGLQGRAAS